MPEQKNNITIIISVLVILLFSWFIYKNQTSNVVDFVVDHNLDPLANVVVPDGLDEATATRYKFEIDGTKEMYQDKPDIWETWIAIGNLKNLLKDYEGAISAYEKSLLLTKNNVLAKRNIAEVYFQGLKNYESAAVYYQLAVDQNLKDVESYMGLALTYHKQLGDLEKAEKAYKDGLHNLPGHPDLMTRLINFYKDIGEQEKYAETVRELRRQQPNNEVYRNAYQDVPLE
jgi:tetratricopeptide (TPR) repeat protein